MNSSPANLPPGKNRPSGTVPDTARDTVLSDPPLAALLPPVTGISDPPPPPPEEDADTEACIAAGERRTPWPRLAALASAGIPYRLVEHPGGAWEIRVPVADEARGRAELVQHRRVNRGWPPHRQFIPETPPVYAGTGVHALLAAAALLLFYVWTGPFADTVPAHLAGEADAARIQAGETWRCVTSLTLHADFSHVLANAVCLAWFGWFLFRSTGAGLGLLVVVLSGAFGNWTNALWVDPDHSAVGASTATFAILGTLMVQQMRRLWTGWRELASLWSRVWLPAISALALLGFLGTGPRSDLGGHLFGFLAGAGFGFLLLPVTDRKLPAAVQWACGLLAWTLPVAAWWVAWAGTIPGR